MLCVSKEKGVGVESSVFIFVLEKKNMKDSSAFLKVKFLLQKISRQKTSGKF